jgi:hypothetical protein
MPAMMTPAQRRRLQRTRRPKRQRGRGPSPTPPPPPAASRGKGRRYYPGHKPGRYWPQRRLMAEQAFGLAPVPVEQD